MEAVKQDSKIMVYSKFMCVTCCSNFRIIITTTAIMAL